MAPNKTSCCDKCKYLGLPEAWDTPHASCPCHSLPQEKELSAVSFVETGKPGLPLVKIDGELLTVKEGELQKYRQALLSQARREYMTSLAERVKDMKEMYEPAYGEDNKAYVAALEFVLGLLEKDLEK